MWRMDKTWFYWTVPLLSVLLFGLHHAHWMFFFVWSPPEVLFCCPIKALFVGTFHQVMYFQMENQDHKGQIPLSRVPIHLLKGDKDLARCWGVQRTFPSYLKVRTCNCGHLIPTATQTCRQFPLLKVKSRSHEHCRVFHQSSSNTLKRLKLRLSA